MEVGVLFDTLEARSQDVLMGLGTGKTATVLAVELVLDSK
jgi:hypothetical protein